MPAFRAHAAYAHVYLYITESRPSLEIALYIYSRQCKSATSERSFRGLRVQEVRERETRCNLRQEENKMARERELLIVPLIDRYDSFGNGS